MLDVVLPVFVVFLLVGPPTVIAAGLLLLFAAGVAPRTPYRVRTRFPCPWTGRVVTADFVVPAAAEHPSDVLSCTAFADPKRITCHRPCRELADVRWAASRGLFPG